MPTHSRQAAKGLGNDVAAFTAVTAQARASGAD
jgi:hypothetical protein